MRHFKIVMLSALVVSSVLPLANTAFAASNSHEIKSFYDDSKLYAIGDQVPALYRTKPYEIVGWQERHLPAPDAGSHWTYIGGSYALITDTDGKILKAENGDIYFQ
ncbi:RcnB family protein [Rahnella sp. PAMC25617]|jgi:Ni/Co efflux regulator RcnB|uniref:RcnB family protein n=1 Tax=Rahnella TaxID=34037 RepID=UPI000DD3AF1A|nr:MULTISPECIES: RcnB family protein [Rahnella]MDH2894749.1 RcnB family protein [Rahnella variigena]TCQ91565.1 nickel/cobalt transporter regulator [Rahnella sp. JUb53]